MTSGTVQQRRLRLYISSHGDTGRQAASNCPPRICEQVFDASSCTLDVVDVRESPELAGEDKILATPTLIRTAPPPQRWSAFVDMNAVLTSAITDNEPARTHGVLRQIPELNAR